MRINIRDKETFLLFIIGFSLSFFIVINGYQLLNAWYMERVKSENEEGYGSSISFTVNTTEEEKTRTDREWEAYENICFQKAYDMLEILTEQKETTYINGLYLPIGPSSEYQYTNVVLAYGEEWYRTMWEGRYPSEQELLQGEKVAVISESAKQYVENINGCEVIKVNGENYQVWGIFDNYRASGYDMEITIFYTLPQYMERDIVLQRVTDFLIYGWPITITTGKNSSSIEKEAAVLIEELERVDGFCIQVTEATDDMVSEIAKAYGAIKGIVLFILFLFSMLNCQQITKLWVLRKKKDLVILKAYGYSNRQVISKLTKELLVMISISLVAVILLNSVYWIITKSYDNLLIVNMTNFLYLTIMFVGVVGLSIAPIIESVKKMMPAEGLREL